MLTTLLKAKLHGACVTHSKLEYEGSCAVDRTLLKASGMHEFEQIQVYNVSNGERFTTYAIQAEPGSGIISVNGAAAHKANPGDKLIICAYAAFNEAEMKVYKPVLVYLDEMNVIIRIGNQIPVQAA